MKNVLEIKGLTKTYGRVTAVKDLNLAIPQGSVFGILGPNGSGKTTTLGMVLGVIQPDYGSFSWFQQSLDFEAKQQIGAILETPNFYPYLSGRKNLEIVATIKELSNPPIDEVLETVNLKARAGSKFKTYSLGMKQRLAIASALLNNPQVMVLDEPTNGLDPQGIAEIRQLIIDVASRGITVILASHLLVEIEKVCTHAAVLRHGNLLFSGTVAELTGQEAVLEVGGANLEDLRSILTQHPAVSEVKNENEHLLVLLKDTASPAEINKFLVSRGGEVNHLVYRKNSLEKQFLNLVSQQ